MSSRRFIAVAAPILAVVVGIACAKKETEVDVQVTAPQPAPATAPETAPQTAPTAMYKCPQEGCTHTSTEPGKCPHHNVDLVEVPADAPAAQSFKCPACGMTASAPGKCSHCNVDLVPVAPAAPPAS